MFAFMGDSLSRRKQGAQSLRASSITGGLKYIHVGLDLQVSPPSHPLLTRVSAF